jgi:hypothetical protein
MKLVVRHWGGAYRSGPSRFSLLAKEDQAIGMEFIEFKKKGAALRALR